MVSIRMAVSFERMILAASALQFEAAGIKLPHFRGSRVSPRRAMRKIKEVLRLKFEAKLSHQRIAEGTRLSRYGHSFVQRAFRGAELAVARGAG